MLASENCLAPDMPDYYLRSSNETTMTDALIEAGIVSVMVHPNGKTERFCVPGATVDHIGPLAWLVYEDGEIIAKSDPGWHTNLRMSEPLTDEQFNILPILDPPPVNPVRRFFDCDPSLATSDGANNDDGS